MLSRAALSFRPSAFTMSSAGRAVGAEMRRYEADLEGKGQSGCGNATVVHVMPCVRIVGVACGTSRPPLVFSCMVVQVSALARSTCM